jgi:hypothetical protein
MELKQKKREINEENPITPKYKISPIPIARQVLRENIKFANLRQEKIKGTLSIRGKIKRRKMTGALRACSKYGELNLYIDEQRDEKVISRVAKDLSKTKKYQKI